MPKKVIRIGGASGYWGDSQEAPKQLIEKGNVDYLVMDYLAEVTMSILVRAKQKSENLGYARDFVELVMKPLLPSLKAKNIKVVVNAGGVNVTACAQALAKVASEAGISLNIGTVSGDDLSERIDKIRDQKITEMFSGKALPEKMVSANAYLGAFPIAAALDEGADVVITGRCVDSALVLGPLIHEFDWNADDLDKLAMGSLAGHIIECGAQATGGNFTDWKDVADGWDNMGYPIAVCRANGTFAITKPKETGGLVSKLTVGEQILYEIGDPANYILPDVVCDFTEVELSEGNEPNWLEVTGGLGKPPTSNYKVSSTYMDGYRSTASTVITGFEAVDKANTYMDALIKRTQNLFVQRNLGEYRGVKSHVIGAETLWGDNKSSVAQEAREVVARLDVRHDKKEALELFSKETTGVALSMTTGRCSAGAAGRPKITPVVAQFAFLIDKAAVPILVEVNGEDIGYEAPVVEYEDQLISKQIEADQTELVGETKEVPLIQLAVARSGDKGNSANIGVMARDAAYLPYIKNSINSKTVAKWFAHNLKGEVQVFELPGMKALNFLLTECLDGGGTSSLYLDNMGKTFGQQILAMPVKVPVDLV